MRCEITNLAGQVQWVKDGFALGFSGVIPGFPRYTILGDRKQGVFNLRISNASIEDNAEYQCQVGPAKLNSAIRANAKLNVICEYYFSVLHYSWFIYTNYILHYILQHLNIRLGFF